MKIDSKMVEFIVLVRILFSNFFVYIYIVNYILVFIIINIRVKLYIIDYLLFYFWRIVLNGWRLW